MIIRAYRPEDEQGWLRCRVLAFLDTAYYDNVLREKETYDNQSIELVAEQGGEIVGLIDVEIESKAGEVCSASNTLSGMIWHIAVHPDYRRAGIAAKLLEEVEKRARNMRIERLEAWTRDDEFVRQWYVKYGFKQQDSYLHVYLDGGAELKDVLKSNVPKLFPVYAFAHYTGADREMILSKFKRVHECIMYDKRL